MTGSLPETDTILLVKSLLKGFGSFFKIVDFSRAPNRDSSSRVDFLECDQLAPSYGKLHSEPVRAMDENLKVAMAASARAIAKLAPDERTWTEMMSALLQNPMLEPLPNSDVDRADKLIKERTNWFKSTEQYEAIVKEVQAWFTKLIVDPDVLKARAEADLGAVTKIVAHAGNTIDGLVPYKKERKEKTLLDIGFLRYPDPDHPFIKVYRIELFAWYESKMAFGHAHDLNGITGQFNVRSFKPRDDVIAGMRASSKKKAIAEADTYFD